jgi:PAS domain S-box-containing protein
VAINPKSSRGQRKVFQSNIPNTSDATSKKSQQRVEKKSSRKKTQKSEPPVSPGKLNNNRQNKAKALPAKAPVPDSHYFETQVAVLNALLNSSDNILSIVDRTYQLINFNSKFVDTVRGLYHNRPQVGYSLRDFYTVEKDWKAAKQILDRALKGETVELESFRGDHPYHRKKFKATYSPIFAKNGAVIGVLTRARDITTQWKLEQDYQHMENLLDAVTKGTRVIICAIDTDYRFTFFNSAYQEEMVRLTGKEIWIGESLLDALADDPAQRKIAQEEWRIVQGGKSTHRTMKFPGAKGDQAVYRVLHTPLLDSKGHQVGAGEVAFDITRQMKMEEALQESEEKYRLLYEHNMDGIFLTAPTGEIFAANQAACKMLQRTEEEICRIGRAGVVDLKDPRVYAAIEGRRKTGRFFTEMTLIKADGSHFEAEVSSFIFKDSHGNQRTSMIVHDITERKKREFELARLNRTLRAHSNSNQAILRAKNSLEYMQQVCQIVLEDCQYAMVWIGLVENDRYKSVQPVAHAGFEEGYLETLKITWADAPRGRGPTGTAIRTGKVCFCRNMLTDPKFEPWRAEAIKRGYASSMALPMKSDGKVVGAITIYSREPDPFSPEEVTLLEELTSDFSFGLNTLKLREEKEKGEVVQRWLASFPEMNPQPIVEVDADGKVFYQNSASRMLMPDLEEKGKAHPWLLLLDHYFEESRSAKSSLDPAEVELRGSHYLQNFKFFPEVNRIRIYGMDISKRKRVESDLKQSEEKFRSLFETMNEGFLLCEVIYDQKDKAVNTRLLDCNLAAMKIMGIPREKAIGSLTTELFHLEKPPFIDITSEVARTGVAQRFESFFEPLQKHLSISATSPAPGRFSLIVSDSTANKQAELHQTWLASFPDNYPWPIAEVDPEGRVFYQNPACRVLFPDLEKMGKSHPWLTYLSEYFEEANSESSNIPSKEVKVGGTYFLQINSYIAESHRVRIYGTDISSRKRAEAAQAWLASFPDIYPWPIIEVDIEGRVFYQNPACRMLFPDLVEKGKNHPWLRHLDLYFDEANIGESLIASRQVQMGDTHFLQTNNYIPETRRVRIYGTDISTRVHAEENRDRLAAILEATPDMVATFTLEGIFLYLNKAGRDMLGLSPQDDVSAYRIGQHMPEWSTQMLSHEAIPQALRQGSWAGETMIIDKNGREVPISQSLLVHRDANGEIAFLSTVARDISQRKQIEDALLQSGAELEQRVKERTQELNESHEKLRQQIEERQRLADSLHDAVNQSLFSAGLIAEVLPRLWERDHEEARKSLQDLRRLTRGAQAEMRALLNELRPSMITDNSLDYLLGILAETFSGRTNIPVSLSVPKDVKLPNDVKTVFYRVCQEALNNTGKHANASLVQICLTQHEGVTDLQISDNGCGFDPNDANISHYGLGMIRERMRSIHGQLSVVSKKSKGCMIHILWPEQSVREEE